MERLEIVSLSLIVFAVLTITLGIIKIHTYPGKVAAARRHPQTEAIEVTSLLGLLIFPLWMLALVWAYSGAVIGELYVEKEVDGGAVPEAGPSTAVPSPGAKSQKASPVEGHSAAAPPRQAATAAEAATVNDPTHTADDAHGDAGEEQRADADEGD